MNNTTPQGFGARPLAAILALCVAACFSCARLEAMMGSENAWADAALGNAEVTGRLDGLEVEHFVGGGLPPPRLRSDQLRLMTRDGRDVIVFDHPDFKTRPTKPGQPYPTDEYTLPATAADVQLVARLVREAFRAPRPESPDPDQEDALHTEIIVSAHGKHATRTYRGGAPPELASLTTVARTLIDRAKTQGVHEVKP